MVNLATIITRRNTPRGSNIFAVVVSRVRFVTCLGDVNVQSHILTHLT